MKIEVATADYRFVMIETYPYISDPAILGFNV
jgi:hypothetical protein